MRLTVIRLLTGMLAVLGLVAAGVGSPAQAASDKRPDRGATRVVIAPRVVDTITAAGITAAPVGEARAFGYEGTLAVRFPISKISPDQQRISHVGGIRLSNGHDTLVLQRFRINLGRGDITALVNGQVRAIVFNLASSGRPDAGPALLTLTRTAATAINDTFGVKAVSAGQRFGWGRPAPR